MKVCAERFSTYAAQCKFKPEYNLAMVPGPPTYFSLGRYFAWPFVTWLGRISGGGVGSAAHYRSDLKCANALAVEHAQANRCE